MQINKPAPDFELRDLQGNTHILSNYRGKIVIINFWSCECPHSTRTDQQILKSLVKWNGEVELLSVAANQNESVENINEAARSRGIPMVLIDTGHVVADLYEAVTTPHVFVVDKDGILHYHGAVDDVTFQNRQPSRFFLDEVVDALVSGHFSPLTETISYGCAIVREI